MRTLWILILALTMPVCAAAGSVVDLGDGWYAGTDNQGRGFTSVPLGDGWRSTIDNEGRWTTTVPIGRGIWANVGPARGTAPVIVAPAGDPDE